ncbi:hypothetical protein N9L47_05965 [Rhodobacteraceae bacterium]|nr:hypothetical protein [Paracoccaceae bacterium]
MNTTAYFDPTNVDTPENLIASIEVDAIDGIPSQGTGLLGAAFVPGTSIGNTSQAAAAAAGTPDATFIASKIGYSSNNSASTVADFIGSDAASLEGNGALEMGPSALTLSGFIYIPPGVHEIKIISDDGFELSIGGTPFSEFDSSRAADETARVADFEGGLYELDLLYFDGGGKMSLSLEMDGLPVDQSAFYLSEDDFSNPPADVPLVPLDEYHPSFFLGEESLDVAVDTTTSDTRDVVTGMGADDTIDGQGGDDEIMGGYGDDVLMGGDGNDVIDGGRGSDVIDGGAGDDTLISRSDAGVQKIGQLAVGQPTRDDPDGEVDEALQKLAIYADQPIKGDDVLIGGEGADTFLIAPQINAKLDIIQKHVGDDGTINWAGVAGENDELHDHWVDSFGIDVIADYNALEDTIAVIGHTANVYVEHADVMGDEALESIVTVISNQHGGGGAHTMDLIGQVIVHGDLVEAEDIKTDANVTYGIVDNYADVAEGLFPNGEEKITVVDGVEYKGYDSRTPSDGADNQTNNGMGTENVGAITGNPAGAFDNVNFTEDMLAAGGGDAEGYVETRAPFDQLGFEEADGSTINGTNGGDTLSQADEAAPDGLPGALGFWSMGNNADGVFADARDDGGAVVKAYTLFENQALVNTEATTDGPNGEADGAMYFNGEDSFAFLEHDSETAITQGTIAMWVRPDDLGEKSMFVTKDQSGSGDGSHFRLGHTDDGGLILRMADPYKTNHTWETDALLTEGEWQHLAVNFTDEGITVYVNGDPVPNGDWTAVEGNIATPAEHDSATLLQNEEPWVFGADQHQTELNDTAAEFAIDDEDLKHEFEGGIAEFGVWGGYTAEDALSQTELTDLIANGPGAALTNPSGAEAIIAADDVIDGMGGNDVIDGEAGDDTLNGGAGNDNVQGGYGDDHLMGNTGNDTLDGGRGSDLLEGGDGDDVLLSRSDTGEQRAGQLVLDDPSRPDDGSIDQDYLKLADWIDQDLIGDDVLVGGAGADKFQFETLINAKKDIIAEHTNDDGTIRWHGVAGENTYIHDHWVDGIGVDVVADFNKAEGDTISVIGHTTEIEVDYHTIDTNGDGIDDDAVSLITLYSQQGNGGGAHDEDYLGYIVVHGDRVEEDDIETDAGAHYGIVDTIHEIQEAVAPTGETKWIELEDGTMHLGYDTRDVEGDPVGTSPWDYSDNAWYNNGEIDLSSTLPDGLEAPTVLLSHDGGTFGGAAQPIEVAHDAGQATNEGTWAFSFSADNPGNGQNQALISKDHSGFEDGGHLTAYIATNGVLKVRFQSEAEEKFLFDSQTKIEANEDYHLAFTFDEDELGLYLNGELIDADTGFADGMTGNEEDLVIGGSTQTRVEDDDNIQWHFDGTIENLALLDRPLEEIEILFLAENNGDVGSLDALYGDVEAPAEEDQNEETTNDSAGDDTSNDDGGNDSAEDDTNDDGGDEGTEETTNDDGGNDSAEDDTNDDGGDEGTEETTNDDGDQDETPEVVADTEEEEDGAGAIFSKIMSIFLSLFGIDEDEEDTTSPPTSEEIESSLEEVESLLNDLFTDPSENSDLGTVTEDEEEMVMMM